jgi:hypothetical protein
VADWLDRDVEMRRLGAECTALEDRAGITAAMERAREGQFMPDLSASSEEYWADEHDAVRRHTRDAYFSIDDLPLRKQLIAAQRRFHAYRIQSFEAEVTDAVKALGVAEAKAKQGHGFATALLVMSGAAAGAVGYGLPGLFVGVPVGYFFGKWRAQEKAAERKTEVDRVTQDVRLAKESLVEVTERPPFFTATEEKTGMRDEEFDDESAFANLFDDSTYRAKRRFA